MTTATAPGPRCTPSTGPRSVTIAGPSEVLHALRGAEDDLRAAGRIGGEIGYADADVLEVRDVVLAPVEEPA